jgi:ubiquinone/menaquinone biosynthesis C-methylase UbiE
VLLTVDLGRLDVQPGDWLLDVGCGAGRHAFGALERGARVVGIDLDPATLRLSCSPLRARARQLRGTGAMVRGNALRLPFGNRRFDRVICSEVMEHVHDFRAAARELARVTRSGGSVAVTVPTATSESLYLRLGDDYFETSGGHIRIFRPRDLARALYAVGLQTTGIGFAHALNTPYWVLRSVVGLPRAEQNPWIRAYRHFLIRAAGSPTLRRLERVPARRA